MEPTGAKNAIRQGFQHVMDVYWPNFIIGIVILLIGIPVVMLFPSRNSAIYAGACGVWLLCGVIIFSFAKHYSEKQVALSITLDQPANRADSSSPNMTPMGQPGQPTTRTENHALPTISVQSSNQQGGITAGIVKIDVIRDKDEQLADLRFQVAASRPMRSLSLVFHYSTGTWKGVTRPGSGLAFRISDMAHTPIAVRFNRADQDEGWGMPKGAYMLAVQYGNDRIVQVSRGNLDLPSIHELEGCALGLAVTEDWMEGLVNIQAIGDGYLLLSASVDQLHLKLAPAKKWVFGLGQAPGELRWLGAAHPNPQVDDVFPLPLWFSPTPKPVSPP